MNKKCWKNITKIMEKFRKLIKDENVEIIDPKLDPPNIIKDIIIEDKQIIVSFGENKDLDILYHRYFDFDFVYSQLNEYKIYNKEEDTKIIKNILKQND